jgi:hypothetical protein
MLKRLTKMKLLWLGAPLLLATGVLASGGASVFAAGPPSSPPGQDPCSHGNSNKPCRPDPSPNGKDCDPHGNNGVGGVNEDHCLGTPATTTDVPVTTTPATTTAVTTTVSTASTTASTPTNSSTTTTAPPSTSTESSSVTPVALGKKKAASGVAGVQASKKAAAKAKPSVLPFTP